MDRIELFDALIYWRTVVAVCNLSLLTMAYWIGVRVVHEVTARSLRRLVKQARDELDPDGIAQRVFEEGD